METWRDVIGCNGRYKASSAGRIKSVIGGRNKLMRTDLTNKGYLYVRLSITEKKERKLTVHRLVAKAFIHNPENKPQVNHKNGIKTDNRIENLEWATPQENSIHAIQKGLKKPIKGMLPASTKLSWCEVNEIRDLKKKGVTTCALSVMFKVSRHQVFRIVNNINWKIQTT